MRKREKRGEEKTEGGEDRSERDGCRVDVVTFLGKSKFEQSAMKISYDSFRIVLVRTGRVGVVILSQRGDRQQINTQTNKQTNSCLLSTALRLSSVNQTLEVSPSSRSAVASSDGRKSWWCVNPGSRNECMSPPP